MHAVHDCYFTRSGDREKCVALFTCAWISMIGSNWKTSSALLPFTSTLLPKKIEERGRQAQIWRHFSSASCWGAMTLALCYKGLDFPSLISNSLSEFDQIFGFAQFDCIDRRRIVLAGSETARLAWEQPTSASTWKCILTLSWTLTWNNSRADAKPPGAIRNSSVEELVGLLCTPLSMSHDSERKDERDGEVASSKYITTNI